MGQEHKSRQASKEVEETTEAGETVDLVDEELNEDVDDLLDEIDSVLEENSQEFVTAFVQQGGELKPQARY